MEHLNSNNIKRAVIISDLSCFGKCSLTVSLPIISHYGIEAVPLPTALLSNHTGGFTNYTCLDLSETMHNIALKWKALDLKFDCIYTGYFSEPKQIDIALEFIKDFKTPNTLLIVDPVMGDNGSLYTGLDKSFVSGMQKLCSLADIITPNLTEAALLTELTVSDEPHLILEKLSTKNAVITGVKNADKIGCKVRINGEFLDFEKPYIDRQLHGCGDVFTSALCGELLSGRDYKTAVINAAEFCDLCIRGTDKEHPYHSYGLRFEPVLKKWSTL